VVVAFGHAVYGHLMMPLHTHAARFPLIWSQEHLALAAKVSLTTLGDFARGASFLVTSNLIAIRAALESVSIEFIAENGGGKLLRKARTA
jgi:hypothetical protein